MYLLNMYNLLFKYYQKKIYTNVYILILLYAIHVFIYIGTFQTLSKYFNINTVQYNLKS